MSDLQKKIVSPERSLVLPSVFNSDKYKVLNFKLETVHLIGVCTINLIKPLVDVILKLSEDVTQLKTGKASPISKLKNVQDSVNVRPQQLEQPAS
jgi:hypothetical protein